MNQKELPRVDYISLAYHRHITLRSVRPPSLSLPPSLPLPPSLSLTEISSSAFCRSSTPQSGETSIEEPVEKEEEEEEGSEGRESFYEGGGVSRGSSSAGGHPRWPDSRSRDGNRVHPLPPNPVPKGGVFVDETHGGRTGSAPFLRGEARISRT